MAGGLGDHRDCLNAGRAGPDLADPFAAEVDALMGPAAGVVPIAGKIVTARDIRHIGRGQATDGGDQIGRLKTFARSVSTVQSCFVSL